MFYFRYLFFLFKKTPQIVSKSLGYFNERGGSTFAAASTFYFILTIVPFSLLLIRVVGYVVGDVTTVIDKIFNMIELFLPNITSNFLGNLKNFFMKPLQGSAQFTILNFVLLSLGSMSFINSLWNGLSLLLRGKKRRSFSQYIEGMAGIGVTIVIVIILFALPSIINGIMHFVESHQLIEKYIRFVAGSDQAQVAVLAKLRTLEFNFLRSNFFLFIFLVTYFTFFYRWLFNWNLRKRYAFYSSVIFSIGILSVKQIFSLYISYGRKILVQNYGDYYTVIAFFLWIYLIMNVFYLGATLSCVLDRSKGKTGQGL